MRNRAILRISCLKSRLSFVSSYCLKAIYTVLICFLFIGLPAVSDPEINQIFSEVLDLETKYLSVIPDIQISIGQSRITELDGLLKRSQNATNPIEKFSSLTLARSLMLDKYQELKKSGWQGTELAAKLGEIIFRARAVRGIKIHEISLSHWTNELSHFGDVEPNNLTDPATGEKVVILRIRHKSGIIFFSLPYPSLTLGGHFKQLAARTNLEAGGHGKHAVFYVKGPEIGEHTKSYELILKERGSSNFENLRKNYWNAKYVPPTKSAALLTLTLDMPLQVALFALTQLSARELGIINEINTNALGLTAGWATVFGLWGQFYNNITSPADPANPKDRLYANLKRMAIGSLSFNIALDYLSSIPTLNGGMAKPHLLWVQSDFAQESTLNRVLLRWLERLVNTFINTYSKSGFKVASDVAESTGISRGDVNYLGSSVNKSQLARIGTALPPNLMKALDILNGSAQIDLSNPDFKLLYKVIFITSALWSHRVGEYASFLLKYDRMKELRNARPERALWRWIKKTSQTIKNHITVTSKLPTPSRSVQCSQYLEANSETIEKLKGLEDAQTGIIHIDIKN